jgi:hypothetical protein
VSAAEKRLSQAEAQALARRVEQFLYDWMIGHEEWGEEGLIVGAQASASRDMIKIALDISQAHWLQARYYLSRDVEVVYTRRIQLYRYVDNEKQVWRYVYLGETSQPRWWSARRIRESMQRAYDMYWQIHRDLFVSEARNSHMKKIQRNLARKVVFPALRADPNNPQWLPLLFSIREYMLRLDQASVDELKEQLAWAKGLHPGILDDFLANGCLQVTDSSDAQESA